MVKWYHAWFGTMRRRFDSFYRDQFRRMICLGLFVKKEKLQRKLEMVIRNMFHQVANIMAVVHGVKEIV
jgi:hypothetical protein